MHFSYYATAVGGSIKSKPLFVCLSHGVAALIYRHAGYLQLSHLRTA